MKIKRIISLVLTISILLGLCGCAGGDGELTLGDLVYSGFKSEDEYTIYLQENGEDVPYLVLKDDYNGEGNVLLLRKYLLDEPHRFNSGYERIAAYYPNSEMDQYLNDNFLSTLSQEIQELVVQSKIEATAESSWLAFPERDEKTEVIERKVFLLASSEVYDGHLGAALREGKYIKYFKNDFRRVATTSNGEARFWCLRTPGIFHSDYIHDVWPDGVKGSFAIGGRASGGEGKIYIRPAFCIRTNTSINEKEGKYFLRI